MTTATIVVSLEFAQLVRQIDCIPEKHAIKMLAPYGADQSFNERMRNRDVRNRLDLSGARTRERERGQALVAAWQCCMIQRVRVPSR